MWGSKGSLCRSRLVTFPFISLVFSLSIPVGTTSPKEKVRTGPLMFYLTLEDGPSFYGFGLSTYTFTSVLGCITQRTTGLNPVKLEVISILNVWVVYKI